MDTVGFLVQQCHQLGHKIQEAEFLNEANDDLIFILDEAQVTYSDSFFWYSVIKERLAAFGLQRPTVLPIYIVWQSKYWLS